MVALSQLKEQYSNELVKQKTKLDDACKHYQNTLKEEQGKLQLKEEELGAANSEISRIKSETAAQTDAVEVQKALVADLQGKICGLGEDLETAKSDKQNLTNALAEKTQVLLTTQSSLQALQTALQLLQQLNVRPTHLPSTSVQDRVAVARQQLNIVSAFCDLYPQLPNQ